MSSRWTSLWNLRPSWHISPVCLCRRDGRAPERSLDSAPSYTAAINHSLIARNQDIAESCRAIGEARASCPDTMVAGKARKYANPDKYHFTYLRDRDRRDDRASDPAGQTFYQQHRACPIHPRCSAMASVVRSRDKGIHRRCCRQHYRTLSSWARRPFSTERAPSKAAAQPTLCRAQRCLFLFVRTGR